MTALRRVGVLDLCLFFFVVAAALGVRAGYLIVCAENGTRAGPLQVQDPRGTVARGVADFRHNGITPSQRGDLPAERGAAEAGASAEQSANGLRRAPLYPWILARFLDVSNDWQAVQRTVRWGQCVLGALTAGFLFLFARLAFRSLFAGALAGLMGAFYPFWIVNTAEIDDGVLAACLLSACLFLGAAAQRPGAWASWLYGLALAFLALTRAALLPFAFVALLWFLWRCRNAERAWMPASLTFLGFASGLAPCLLHNYQVARDVYPVVDSTYYHLWAGNHAGATGGPETAGAGSNPRNTDRQLAQEYLDEARSNVAGTLGRRIWAGLYFFFGADWFKKGKLWRNVPEDSASNALPVWLEQSYPALLTGSLLGVLLLGVLGWRWTFPWRQEAMPAALAILWVPLPYILSHAEALQGPRLPLDGVLMCYAAYALESLFYLPPTVSNLKP